MKKRGVVVLGATGLVGQRLIADLASHPWFDLQGIAASEKNVGRKYGDAVNWRVEKPLPAEVARMTLLDANVKSVKAACDAEFVMSCLPGGIAKVAEQEFAAAGTAVFSKASDHRMEKDVPLIIPEVNPDHAELVKAQQKNRNWSGFITTDPNCSTTGLVLSLFPIAKFGIKKVIVTTMQALSGAGYPGVASLDALGNVIPYIGGEEEKMEKEPKKILGKLKNGAIVDSPIEFSASCNRVPVADGHMESIFVQLDEKPSVEELKKAWNNFSAEPQKLKLPSAPAKPTLVREEPNRPQPQKDVFEGNGMTAVIGRVRPDPVLGGVKYSCLSHNLVRGAAGEALLEAEYFAAKKLF